MKKLFLLIVLVFAFVSCGDDDKKDDPKECSPVCESWQTCNTTSGVCELSAGKCTENTNCTTEQECDLTTHECKAKVVDKCLNNTCSSEEKVCDGETGNCIDLCESVDCSALESCNWETGTCVALTCNENLIPSDLSVTDSCSEIESVDCMVSSDCDNGKRCENVGGEYEVACCVPGLRGCKEAGEPCTSELECADGLCLNRNDGAFYCSKMCQTNADCPEPISECADMYFFNACAVPNTEK